LLLPGIGDVTARAAIEDMAASSWGPDAFARFVAPPRAREAHRHLVALIEGLRSASDDEGAVAMDIVRVRQLYDDILRERYDRVDPRLADLDQLQTIAGGYPSRGAFLATLALEPPQATQDLAGAGGEDEEDALILSTVHSAKGKEWDAVFVIWAVDGFFPLARSITSEEELEEERRLMYVATTRPRNHLMITYPLNQYATRRGADYSIDQLSRFIDRGVMEHMQRVVPQFEDAVVPESSPDSEPGLDLRALLRGRFGN